MGVGILTSGERGGRLEMSDVYDDLELAAPAPIRRYSRRRMGGGSPWDGEEAPMRAPVRPPTLREFQEPELLLMEAAGLLDVEGIWDVDPVEEDVEEP